MSDSPPDAKPDVPAEPLPTVDASLQESKQPLADDTRSGKIAAPATVSYQLPSADADTDPTHIGRYRIDKLLGKGGFGRVYLAYDSDLERPVAIKVPRGSSPEDVEAYLAEAKTVARLDHPRIVPVLDVGRTAGGLCFVVSRFIAGSDLARRSSTTCRRQPAWGIALAPRSSCTEAILVERPPDPARAARLQ